MAKKVVNQIKLQIPAGKANPSPPIGPALGAAGALAAGTALPAPAGIFPRFVKG